EEAHACDDLDLDDFKKVLKNTPKKMGMWMTRLTKAKNLTGVLSFFGLLNNIWLVTYYRAVLTGYILADNIARLHKGQKIDLFGHSLGGRVIFYALQILSTKEEIFVENVYLFGGAQERKDDSGWQNATKAISGKIYNIYSSNDYVLKILYQCGTLGSSPIGLKPIEYENDKIVNIDASEWVDGHSAYHEKFSLIMDLIEKHNNKTEIHLKKILMNNKGILIIVAVFILVLMTIIHFLVMS
ncbi:MAG: DUF726 domain-containing protein, partial [Bacteroidetes bacterium]|nr:DUF726 domain-containing protein [Bacteroidota bacterium]